MKNGLCILAGGLLLAWLPVNAAEPWSVHEWGTFTSLQDEAGKTLGGINTDDEPVPPFVHRLNDFVLLRPSQVPGIFFQGAPRCHPDVTMRLETPVLYFHRPPSAAGIQSATVRVRFRGGWLSEFYPAASLSVPGLEQGRFHFGPLSGDTESELAWNHLQIGGVWPITNTTAPVWTSPRAVKSALVRTEDGESEKFLFYRGVAHIDAPLKISHDATSGELRFQSQLPELHVGHPLLLHDVWLVDVRPDGKTAFRRLEPLSLAGDPQQCLTTTPDDFEPDDFTAGNLELLKAELRSALVAAGLFDDEAAALLNTWQLSYFKSSGRRVFFLVPREWTDFYLPLEISPPANVQRVMVGRIELVTSRQRRLLRELSLFSTNAIWQDAVRLRQSYYGRLVSRTPGSADRVARVNDGQEPLASVVSVPKTYQTYLDLGRFRNTLVLETAKDHPTVGLTNFIAIYNLFAYQPPASTGNP